MPGKRYVLIAVLCVYVARAWAKRLTHNSLEIIHLVKKISHRGRFVYTYNSELLNYVGEYKFTK